MISRSLDWYIVGTGNYRGDLVVQRRKVYPEGTNALFWLISPAGKELGYVGESENNVREFLKDPKRQVRRAPE